MAGVQALRGTSVTITETFSVDGVPTDLDSGVPTIVAKFPDGGALTPAPVASGAWTGRTTGQYRIQLDPQPEVTYLDPITWTGTIGGKQQVLYSRVEWVGAVLFNLSDLRGLKVANGYPFATDATPLFSNQQIRDARAAVLDEFTRYLQVSPVPRFRRAKLHGDGRSTCLNLPTLFAHRLLSLTVNGVAQDVAGYEVTASGQLESVSNYGYGSPFPWGRFNVVAEWVHGWGHVEGIGSHMAMLLAARELDPSGFSNATTVTTPDGMSYSYEPSEVGRDGFQRFTGIRVVDRWLNDARQVSIGIA